MKVLIFNGAGKKNGKTAELVRAFTESAQGAGHEVTELYLQTMDIHGCLDCQGCAKKEVGADQPCVQRDDMMQVYPQFSEADVVVFASPVYWWDITGTLKTAIDRLYAVYRVGGAGYMPKRYALLMTSGGSPIDHMKDWCRNLDNWLQWTCLGCVMNDAEEAKRLATEI